MAAIVAQNITSFLSEGKSAFDEDTRVSPETGQAEEKYRSGFDGLPRTLPAASRRGSEMGDGSYAPAFSKDAPAERARLAEQADVAEREELSFLRSVGLRPAIRLLDLGCGSGAMTRRLASVASGGEVVGVDSNPGILPRDAGGHGIKFVLATAGALPFPPRSFDFIYARFLLQHATSPREVVDDAVAKLARGGTLALLDTDDAYFAMDPGDSELDDLMAQAREVQTRLGGDRHVGRKLPGLVGAAGLGLLACRVRVFNSAEMPFETIFRLATGFKAALLGKAGQFDEVGKRLAPRFGERHSFLTAGVVAVAGRKT
jgi:SAM-dependent methyltransferase